MSKNTENANNRAFYAVVAPFRGVGEPKLILHEIINQKDISLAYGIGDTLVIDPSAVLRYDRETLGITPVSKPISKEEVN